MFFFNHFFQLLVVTLTILQCSKNILLNLQVKDEHEFTEKLQCTGDTEVKVVSIFGNTGDGKSHTLNHTFFGGKEVFQTSSDQLSCTIGVWASYDSSQKAIILDTEGLLGVTSNQNQRTRLLLKVLAISDLILYRTRADRLTNDLFQFLGDASAAYLKHFKGELKAASQRFNLSTNAMGPAAIIFHETQHTYILGKITTCYIPWLNKFLMKSDWY